MIQPETWKKIHDAIGPTWSVLGPLVGIGVGAWLSRSGDRKKWLNDKRAEECRELITSITHSATLRLNMGQGISPKEANDAYMESLRIIHDRIFIAEEVEEKQVLESWAHAVGDLNKGKISDGEFSDRLKTIRETIVKIAMRS
jgi:hypothetical protein